MKRNHIQHLYWRAGFGILPPHLDELKNKTKKDIISQLFQESKTQTSLKIDTSEIEKIISDSMVEKIDPKTRMAIQKISRKKQVDLNKAWFNRLSISHETLREKMTLFWANVFVCEDNNIIYIQQFNNTLREYALGNFGEFVKAVSKEAAMTKYLNTKQNRKQSPNENFARELMELFTLGEGHYTEDDIKESARAFTGYSHDLNGDFVFRKWAHDNGEKTFFGKTGNFDGEDVIDIILEQKQCAIFICTKLYRYFVSDHVDDKRVNEMADLFYEDYNIEKLMRYVFLADWFYDEANIGAKIKSPIEFLVGLNKLVPINYNKENRLLFLQRQLGQVLLDPPNVAGWKGGKSWIDSNTIVLRLKLPSMLLNNAYISKANNNDPDDMEFKKESFRRQYGKYLKTEPEWDVFIKNFSKVPIDELHNMILSCKIESQTNDYLKSLSKVSKQEHAIRLMSLPEYQMC